MSNNFRFAGGSPVRRRLSALVLAASLVAAAGCTNSGPSEPAEGEGGSTEPMTIRLVNGDVNPNWDDMQSDIGKVIQEKTGITLKQEFPVGGNDTDLFSIMVASGDYPDLVMPKGSAGKLVDAGALIDLTELIDKHGPNIKKVYGEYMNRLRWSNEDHSIYILPVTGVNNKYFDAGGGFQIQHRVLKELGYPKIETVKDYENAIRTYLKEHPTDADGKPNIGMSLNAGEWQILISTTNPAFLTTGAPDDGEMYIDQKTYEAKLHYLRPEEKEYFRWLNHMYNTGLLDPESFIQKYDQYKAKIASGRVLGTIDQKWDYEQAEYVLKKEGKFDQTYARLPVTLNESYKDHSFQETGYLAGWGIGITKSAKDPVRLIKFLDYLASDEGQVLLNWGIEGVHYKVENGKRVFLPEYQEMKTNDKNGFKKKTGIENYFIAPRYGDGVKDPSGNYYTTIFPEQVISEYTEADKETLKAYGKTVYKDFWPSEDEFPMRPYGAAWSISFETGSEANVIFEKTQDIMKKRVPEAIMASPEQFDAVWDAFMQDLQKAKVDKLNEEYTKMVRDRIKLWSGE
ncbi:ABC transporter substrate-binding protein [Paenibacillus turpanensis]|uniref:ABC transporter substrate-binding protein n=1 Tax=Paenibacillus turpanensis TaxID=2689078 RepID=UPI001409ADCB|nr:ABC transporter substrate-binding protein [Paenibacillus turpanensis]